MKLKVKYCTFCGEDAIDVNSEGKALLACTSCGRVISYQEIEKVAVETFKAMSLNSNFPTVSKEPEKVRAPLFLDRHVTYLHADGKTWERVPMQLYINEESDSKTPTLRLGHNIFEIRVVHVTDGHRKSCKRSSIWDSHIDSKKANRKELLDAHFGHTDKLWPSKPFHKKGEFGYGSEIKAWKEEAKRDKISLKRWRMKSKRNVKLSKSLKSLKKKLKEQRAQEVKESEFTLVIKPFVKRSRKKAVNVYQALSNMQWQRVKDKKIYSCTWRHAGGLVAEIRDKNEVYTDYYCSGGEGDVTKEFEAYMRRKGWEKLPWD